MSCKNDSLTIRSRKQRCLQGSSSSRRASPPTRTFHSRICSSSSLPSYVYSSQANHDHPQNCLDDITLESDLDRCSASFGTLLSHRASSLFTDQLLTDATCAFSELDSESHQSRLLYPLREPGQMTAQRTQRLRARTAAVITSLPATFEDVDEHEHLKAAETPQVAHAPKLRRVSGVRDLRRAFRDGDHEPVHFASSPTLGDSKASYELGILDSSALTPRSSLLTLVELGNPVPQSAGDLKTLCGSTLSSISISSRFSTKVHSVLFSSHPPHTLLPTESSSSILPKKHVVHNSMTPRPQRRHISLQLDTSLSHSPEEVIWSCAKISRSAVKRAARRGHAPRRVFSHPIPALSS